MAKAEKLHFCESCRIVELHKHGLSPPTFAAEVGRSETIVLSFSKDSEGY